MRDHLHPFADEIERFARRPPDVIDQAILLWRAIYGTALEYRRKHGREWLFVRHEDLSQDPVSGFRALHEGLGLQFTPRVERGIRRSSSERNPAHQGADAHSIRLNSRANLKGWKSRLTQAEIHRIRRGLEDVACSFYDENEWA